MKDLNSDQKSSFESIAIPDKNKKVDAIFQHWLTLPESQNFIQQELKSIDPALEAEYTEKVKNEMKMLVEQIQNMNVAKNGKSLLCEIKCKTKDVRIKYFENSKKDSGISLDEHLESDLKVNCNEIPKFYFPFGDEKSFAKSKLKADWKVRLS
jgi:hypothetical protein